jgi:hypothetical protein
MLLPDSFRILFPFEQSPGDSSESAGALCCLSFVGGIRLFLFNLISPYDLPAGAGMLCVGSAAGFLLFIDSIKNDC